MRYSMVAFRQYNSYMGDFTYIISFGLEWPWRVKINVAQFLGLISSKKAELGQILLLNINRKSYLESSVALSHLTLSDLEKSKLRSVRFGSFISRKGVYILGPTLQFNINRKPIMRSPMSLWHLTSNWLWKIKIKATKILKSYSS